MEQNQIEHLKKLIASLAEWQLCMSYNDSYFGEPAGLVKSTIRELTKLIESASLDNSTPKSWRDPAKELPEVGQPCLFRYKHGIISGHFAGVDEYKQIIGRTYIWRDQTYIIYGWMPLDEANNWLAQSSAPATVEAERTTAPVSLTDAQIDEIAKPYFDKFIVYGDFRRFARSVLSAAGHAPAATQERIAQLEQQREELGQEVRDLVTALAFWMPKVDGTEGPLAERVFKDCFLLAGIDGNLPNDFKTAQELGWITLVSGTAVAAAPAPIQQEPASSMWYVRQLRYEKRADGGEDLVSEVYKEGQGEERIEVRTQKQAPQSHQFACMLAQALTAWEGNERHQFTVKEIDLFRQWFDNVEDLNQQYLELADYDLAKKLYPLCGCRWSDRSEDHRKKLLNQSMR